MFSRVVTYSAFLFSTLFSGIAWADCVLSVPTPGIITYGATKQASGVLKVLVSCEADEQMRQYTLNVVAFGGYFDQSSGAFIMGALSKSNSILQMQILGASPALGGTKMPTIYTGSQSLEFPLLIASGQWEAVGKPTAKFSIELTTFSVGKDKK